MRIQTPSSDLSLRTLSTGGRRASRAVMETRHLYCWSHCLNVEVDFLPYPNQMFFKERPSLNVFEAKTTTATIFLLCSALPFVACATLVTYMWCLQRAWWQVNQLHICCGHGTNTPHLTPQHNELFNKWVTNEVLKFKPFTFKCLFFFFCDYMSVALQLCFCLLTLLHLFHQALMSMIWGSAQ